MVISLAELKGYLRIDTDDDDSLLQDMITAAETTCAGILRVDSLEGVEAGNLKIAVLYAATYMYEHREEASHNKMNLTLRALLFADRSDEF